MQVGTCCKKMRNNQKNMRKFKFDNNETNNFNNFDPYDNFSSRFCAQISNNKQ
jgi:hypothetical protein